MSKELSFYSCVVEHWLCSNYFALGTIKEEHSYNFTQYIYEKCIFLLDVYTWSRSRAVCLRVYRSLHVWMHRSL